MFFRGWISKLHVIKTFGSYWKQQVTTKQHLSFSNILSTKIDYSSQKTFENKVITFGENELTNVNHDLNTLLTTIFQEW